MVGCFEVSAFARYSTRHPTILIMVFPTCKHSGCNPQYANRAQGTQTSAIFWRN